MIQEKKPFKAFVYIIESPGAKDLLNDDIEGKALTEALKLCKIPSTYSLACNQNTFKEALSTRLIKACNDKECYPILHFSMHGNYDGIGLTDDTFISWSELRELLLTITLELQFSPIICFSTCFGINSFMMEFNDRNDNAFFGVVGHSGTLSWSDSAVAYITFYNRLFQTNGNVEIALKSMKNSIGDTNFYYFPTANIKNAYFMGLQNSMNAGLLNHPVTFMGDNS